MFIRIKGVIKRIRFRQDLTDGVRDSLPIAFGYFAVSFAYGIYAVTGGLPPLTAALVSLTNLTSAGQFAGTGLIFTHAPYLEIALTTLLINLRYMLMSLSLSQRIRPDMGVLPRLLIGYGVTDEIYAVAIHRPGELGKGYLMALIALPALFWTGGTLAGGLAGSILPPALRSALGIALYAMFVAIVMPAARRSRPVCVVALLAAVMSLACTSLPGLNGMAAGWRIIVCTILAATIGALIAPVRSDETAGTEDL